MNQRIEYAELKNWALEGIYDHLKHGVKLGSETCDLLEALNHVAANYETSFEYEMEDFMFYAILAVIGSNQYGDWARFCVSKMREIKATASFDKQFARLPQDEEEALKSDLKALSIFMGSEI